MCDSHIQVENASKFISLHLGLLPNRDLSPCICFVRQDSAVKMDDGTFFQIRKYFPTIDAFFHAENAYFNQITINGIVLRVDTPISEESEKLICIEEYDQANTLQHTICINLHEWEQLIHLRDVLCLQLSLLRKYSIYGRLVFDRLVNHLATVESNEL